MGKVLSTAFPSFPNWREGKRGMRPGKKKEGGRKMVDLLQHPGRRKERSCFLYLGGGGKMTLPGACIERGGGVCYYAYLSV